MKYSIPLLILLSLTCLALTDDGRFVAIGPYGGFEQEIALTENFLFSFGPETNNTRVYRSNNQGLSWQPLSFQAQLIRVHPRNPNKIVAYGSSLYLSTDGGRNWQKISSPFKSLLFDDLEFHTTNSTTLYGSIDGSLYRSPDDGKTWQKVGTYGLGSFIVHPKNGEELYFPSDGRLYRSTDGGHTSQLLASVANPFVSLIMDRRNPKKFYARSTHHLLRSIDGGITWSATPCDCESLTLDRINSRILYSYGENLKKTSNNGHSWTSINLPTFTPNHNRTIYTLIAEGDSLFASANDSIYRSLDGGKSWLRINTGLREIAIRSLEAVDSKAKNMIAAGAYNTFRTTDAGKTWRILEKLAGYHKIEKHPRNPNLIYAYGSSYFAISKNGGANWSFRTAQGYTFALDPKNENILFSTIESGYGRDRITSIGRSTNQGLTWRVSNEGITEFIRSLAVSPANSKILLAGSSNSIFRSNNAGASWHKVKGDLCCDIDEIRFHPVEKEEVWAASGISLLRSLDAGISWTESLTFPVQESTRIRFVTFDPLKSNRIFAGGTTLLISEDNGDSWRTFQAKGLFSSAADAMISLPNQLLLATKNGMYRLNR
ncbi:hypothetical protein L0244_34310 [bacterium]|nr:hypothetical protein [bacterium]